MLRRMLVPIDGTRSSTSVVPYAAEIAKRLGCRVDILLVEPEEGAEMPHPLHHHHDENGGADAVPAPEEIHQANKRHVRHHAEEFEALGVEASSHVRIGVPVDEILQTALDLRCDLIAMATRHRGRFARPDSTSVAEEVVWRSRLPVLLVAEG
ncbi:MAG: universal stress protein [Dehalococcoidia bacterium]